MSTSPAVPTRHEIEAKIARKAWTDAAFRAEFLADPAAAFTRYAGVPAGNLPRIVVHEEAPGSWHIVLPARPATAGEISDEDLEKIAGGTDVVATIVSGIVLTLVTAGATATIQSAASSDCW